jgi:hypothetical protein
LSTHCGWDEGCIVCAFLLVGRVELARHGVGRILDNDMQR